MMFLTPPHHRTVQSTKSSSGESAESDRLLKEQIEEQEQYSDELVRLAQTLKESSILFGETLKKDSEV
jgi:cell shape-determining protein MreC